MFSLRSVSAGIGRQKNILIAFNLGHVSEAQVFRILLNIYDGVFNQII